MMCSMILNNLRLPKRGFRIPEVRECPWFGFKQREAFGLVVDVLCPCKHVGAKAADLQRQISPRPGKATVYDPVCVSSFFAGAAPLDYAINRAIDAKLSALSWDDVEGLMNAGGLRRTGHLLRQCKALVAQAKADWPALLQQAPPAMAAEVLSRLGGKVALCA